MQLQKEVAKMIHIIGDGGHAKVIREFVDVLQSGPYSMRFGCFFDLHVVAIGDNATRKRVAQEQQESLASPAQIHPSAVVSKSATIGAGTVVMAGAVIQANACIGLHCIINTGATVDHDCELEDFVHIAPGAHLCGGVHVGEGALIAVGVGEAPGAVIPPWSTCKAARLDICPMKL